MKHKVRNVHFVGIGGARLSYPARGPAHRAGIDGKAKAAGRRFGGVRRVGVVA